MYNRPIYSLSVWNFGCRPNLIRRLNWEKSSGIGLGYNKITLDNVNTLST